jgi:hypothetical protein
MKKIFLVAVLAILVGAILLTSCSKGEAAAEPSPEIIEKLDAEFAEKLEQLSNEEKELILGEDKALTGLAYLARSSIMSSSFLGYSCQCTKCCCSGKCCTWKCN